MIFNVVKTILFSHPFLVPNCKRGLKKVDKFMFFFSPGGDPWGGPLTTNFVTIETFFRKKFGCHTNYLVSIVTKFVVRAQKTK